MVSYSKKHTERSIDNAELIEVPISEAYKNPNGDAYISVWNDFGTWSWDFRTNDGRMLAHGVPGFTDLKDCIDQIKEFRLLVSDPHLLLIRLV